MPVLEQSRSRYLRAPHLVANADGGASLYVLAWEGGGDDGHAEKVLAFAVDASGAILGDGRVLTSAPAIADLDRFAAPPTASDDHSLEDLAKDGDATVRVERGRGRARVVLTRASSESAAKPIVVFDAPCIAAAPAVVALPEGTWVAFHHDLREDTERRDLVKWIALRFVDPAGRVFEPKAPFVDRDRDRLGEEQGFEYPSLIVGADGSVTLFGRGSHRFWRQDLSERGWTSRSPIGEGGWGCRGRRVSAVRLQSGALLTARREKVGVVVERMEASHGGRPALTPAQVELASPRISTHTWRPPAPRDTPRAFDGRAILFGDIHQHSAHSDGCGSAHEAYVRARDFYQDDFCALTDHESFLGKRVGPGEQRHLEQVAEAHDEPGKFTTLFAYEWTAKAHPGPGHKVIYAPRAGLPILSRDDLPEGRDLVRAVREQGGICVPHHVGWTGADADSHDLDTQPVWEICSCHGCYEAAGHPLGQRGELRDQMVDAMLMRGLRFGFIACSDSHGLLWHHGIARKRDAFRTGLTAVAANENTREGIFSALRARRCYATSGAKIVLDLRVVDPRAGEVPMGGVVRAAGPLPCSVTTRGTARVKTLSLVGPRGTIAYARGEGADVSLEAEILGPWAYARVEQEDGEMAWSSPVYFDPPT